MYESPIIPIPQTTDRWKRRYYNKLQEKRSLERVDLLFLGDSITEFWEDDIPSQVWQQYYQDRYPLNLGYAGDKTQNLLWRIHHGELDGLCPKLVVLLIGTNNTGHGVDDPRETAAGIKFILDELQTRMPMTKILLMAIFPRSARPTQKLRLINDQVNQLIQQYADNQRIFFCDISPEFLNDQDEVEASVMPDFLHLHDDQYQVWAQAMEPYVKVLMDEGDNEADRKSAAR